MAAGLDVMVEEPPKPDHQLFTLKNAIFSPHAAARPGIITRSAGATPSTIASVSPAVKRRSGSCPSCAN